MIHNVMTRYRAVGSVRVTKIAALSAYRVDVAERQTIFPRIVTAQQIGQLGAIDVDVDEFLIRLPIGIGFVAQAALRRTAVARSDRGDKFSESRFVGVGPVIFDDVPRFTGLRAGREQTKQ